MKKLIFSGLLIAALLFTAVTSLSLEKEVFINFYVLFFYLWDKINNSIPKIFFIVHGYF